MVRGRGRAGGRRLARERRHQAARLGGNQPSGAERAAHCAGPTPHDRLERTLRTRARLAIRMMEPGDIDHAERTIRRSIFKDTDARSRASNRKMSLPISIALRRTPLTANQLSVLLVAIGFYSGWLFSIGHYWTGFSPRSCRSLPASSTAATARSHG